MGSASPNAETAKTGRRQIEPFNYKGVNLEAGRFRQQFAEVSTYYLHLPNDSLLKPYRQRAGKEAPGADMGGCYVGHNPFGQFLSGLARMYAATGDSAYKDKAVALMDGWAKCIEPDGFFFAEKKPQLIPYYYEKMVCGLVDLYEYCGEKRALEHLERITAWAEKNVSRVRRYAGSGGNDGGEWYTLSENLYRAYLLTKNERYLDFAKVWEYSDFWSFFAQGQGTNIFTRGPAYHAYSHVNSFCGLGAGYLAGGNPDYLNTLINAYDYLQEHQCWATGGFGPKEALLPRERFAAMLSEAPNHFETQCGSWAGFKLTKYLISLTGDARYGDWTERLLLNGIGASLPISDGKPFYYSEHNTSGSEKQLSKGNNSARWPCCSGTRSQATADLHDIIYYRDADGLYITQFIPSTVRMKVAGTDMKVTQETSFPESDTVLVRVAMSASAACSIKVRMPGWLAEPMQAWVNGVATVANGDDKHWAVFKRQWSDGDTLKLRLPMKLWVSRINKEKAHPAAIMVGPVAMGVGSVNANPAKKIDLTNLDTALVPVKGKPLTWRLAADRASVVKPFYAFKEGEKYYIYLDPCPPIGASYKAARYSGGWRDFGKWITARAPGSWLEYRFEGQGIRIHYFKYDDGGRFQVIIDGKNIGTLDVYGPKRGVAAFAEFSGFQHGRHTLKMVLLPERSPKSKGVFGNVAAFESIQKGVK
jgi:hypothetical protein